MLQTMNDIILIGGVPRSGKTQLARRLSRELSVPWVSTDALEAIAHRYVPNEDADSVFPKAAMRRETKCSNDLLYGTYTTEEILDSYMRQAEATAPGISALVGYAAKEGWGYVIEGYHVTPALVSELGEQGCVCEAAFLVNSSPHAALNHSMTSSVASDWVRDRTESVDTLEKIADMITLFSTQLTHDAKGCNMPVFDVGASFEEVLQAAYDRIVSRA